MDAHAHAINALKVNRTIKALEANHIKGYFVSHTQELFEVLKVLISPTDLVSVGGSVTLFETGVIEWLRHYSENFLDRYKEGLSPEEITKLYRDSFSASVYLMSSNAVTESGCLYNVDGRGNRVAALTFGPDRVVVIVGMNKLVKDEAAAIERNRRLAAPANAHRLDRKTPCVVSGYCTDCTSPDRICAHHVMTKRQTVKDRIHVIIVDGEFGY